MATDLFNNISSDYIYPDLPPCPGVNGGQLSFEFLPGQQVGIVSGSNVLSTIYLGDISEKVSSWYQQSRLLQPGEVTFIQGLTKGISNKKQVFPFIGDVEYTGNNHSLYMSADVSISYYINFKHYNLNVFVTSDPDNEITIENAFNIKFDELGINVTTTYDPSSLSFTSNTSGYYFNIGNMDVSLWEPDSSIFSETLIEDTSSRIPAFKYPNTAMLGYVLKVSYPSIAENYESYIKINHVPDYLEWFELNTDPSCEETYIRHYQEVDVGLNVACAGSETMSAGDYLDYVEANNKWEMVGAIRIWLSSPDPLNSNIENLITGFYVFNPQTFPIQLIYKVIA